MNELKLLKVNERNVQFLFRQSNNERNGKTIHNCSMTVSSMDRKRGRETRPC